jgi:hypothetical protein
MTTRTFPNIAPGLAESIARSMASAYGEVEESDADAPPRPMTLADADAALLRLFPDGTFFAREFHFRRRDLGGLDNVYESRMCEAKVRVSPNTWREYGGDSWEAVLAQVASPAAAAGGAE